LAARIQVLLQVVAFQKLVFRGVFDALESRARIRFGAALIAKVDTGVAIGLFWKEVNERKNDNINTGISTVRR
jgi:hypothetical protein